MNLYFLISECRKNNVIAQRKVYELFQRKMFLICRRYMRNDLVAEEVLMNGFFVFFTTLDKFEYRNEEATESWLKRIMVTNCFKQLDKGTVIVRPIEELPDPTSDEDIISNVSLKELYTLITKLPAGYRIIFNLFYLENLSHDEIAEKLRIKKASSKSQLCRARLLLREMFLKINKDYEYKTRK